MSRRATREALVALDLDRTAGTPMQRQLYDQLRGLILRRGLPAETRLPSTRSLAADLGVSRNTIVGAFDQLLAEGYLVSQMGSGTYVSPVLPDALLDAGVASGPAPASALPRGSGRPGLSRRGRALAASVNPRTSRHRAFTPGLPALDEFPFQLWARLLARPWRRPEARLLAFGDPAGDRDLRAEIAAYLGAVRAVRCDADQVIIVSGAQHGLDIATRVLLDPGDAALVEEPGYVGAWGALTGAGVDLISVPVDEEGLDIAAGERRAPNARLACVAPSHQYPLGVTMSLRRRLALLDWAARHGAWILEDDYDSEYRYAGRPLAALQGLDRSGSVIYIGSFSKVLFPSLRLGYLVVPPDLVTPFRRARAALDDHPSSIAQGALARFIADGHFAAHVRRTRRLYAARRQALLEAGNRHLCGLLDFRPSQSGMHLVGMLSPDLSARLADRTASDRLAEAGITASPLSGYYRGGDVEQGLLLGYAAVPEAEIEPAVRRMAAVLAG